MSEGEATFLFPAPFKDQEIKYAGESTNSFSVDAQGHGSLTGLAYTVPPHSEGVIEAELQTLSLTSQNIADLNNLISGMVSASKWESIKEYESTHASANISIWSFWSAGGSASYTKTREAMSGFGLSEENIKTIVSAMAEIAKKMSTVKIRFTVFNSQNDYSVSGNLLLWTISGIINTGEEQVQYRMLANKGTAGSNGSTAPAAGEIIPLN